MVSYFSNSTETAARSAGVSYITLRRWLASGAFVPPSSTDPATGPTLKYRSGKTVWRFTAADMSALRDYVADNYAFRRGRAAKARERQKKPTHGKLQRARWRYRMAVAELAKVGLRPRDGEIVSLA